MPFKILRKIAPLLILAVCAASEVTAQELSTPQIPEVSVGRKGITVVAGTHLQKIKRRDLKEYFRIAIPGRAFGYRTADGTDILVGLADVEWDKSLLNAWNFAASFYEQLPGYQWVESGISYPDRRPILHVKFESMDIFDKTTTIFITCSELNGAVLYYLYKFPSKRAKLPDETERTLVANVFRADGNIASGNLKK